MCVHVVEVPEAVPCVRSDPMTSVDRVWSSSAMQTTLRSSITAASLAFKHVVSATVAVGVCSTCG